MRKIKYFLLLLLVTFHTILQSQSSKTIDSLILLQSEQEGIALARTLNELSWEYAKKNDSLALDYAQQAEEISRTSGYTLELATSYIRQGTVYLNNSKFEEAEHNLNKALELEKKEGNQSGIARAKIQLGKLYKKTRNYNKAIQSYNECIVIQERLQNKKKIARLYNNLGVLYEEKNEPIKALQYYHNSIKLRDSIQDKRGLIISYKNIGAFYIEMKKYRKALIELEKGRKLGLELQDSIQLASILTNVGSSYNYIGELDSAFIYFNQSLAIKEKIQDKNQEAVYNNIGLIEEKRNNFDLAIEFYEKSITIAKKNKNELQLIDVYHNIGRTYKKKDLFNKALEFYFKALKLAEKHKREYRVLDILSGIGKAYELLGDYENANLYNEKHIVIRNQLEAQARKNEEAINLLNEQRNNEQNKNKVLKIEKEKLEAENNTKTTQLIGLIVGSILLSILFFMLFKYYRQKKEKEIAIQNEKIKQGEIEELLKTQELKSIHAMIDGQEKERKRIAQDLHDRLGSMLSVVKIHYKSVEENLEKMKADSKIQYEKANELLDEACVAVREISHNMVSGVLTKFGLIPALHELKQNVENTGELEIELVDYGFDDRVANETEINIYRIIQELISNIMKHANAKEVSIQLLKKETNINITVIDDGDGFNTHVIKNFSGMGIKGIQSRVENLQGEVVFDSGKGNGTTVTIDIPIDQQKYTT